MPGSLQESLARLQEIANAQRAKRDALVPSAAEPSTPPSPDDNRTAANELIKRVRRDDGRWLTAWARICDRVLIARGEDPCWYWEPTYYRAVSDTILWETGTKPAAANRVLYMIFIGDVPPRTKIVRNCRNRRKMCINPWHQRLLNAPDPKKFGEDNFIHPFIET